MEISIESPYKKFQNHISVEQNSRILFSAKFGTGKSYFLKKFFEKENESYNLFWLSPINYVVGANQDIFEWIKVDLAKDIVTKYLPPKKENIPSKNFLIQSYIYKNAGAIFAKLTTALGNDYLRNKTGVDFLDTFKDEIEEYKKFEISAIEDLSSNSSRLQSFLNLSFQLRGSIYEDDITTRIIRASIEYLKFNNQDKKNVLVIDDLDRLDPEHIFRILNILSAHNDHFDTNKFGFDKVILVCDLDNIETLYKYKYGQAADFEGYIDKFFTYEPFYYSLTNAIITFCEEEIAFKDLDNSTRRSISLLLTCLFKNNLLRTRNLKKISSEKEIVKSKSIELRKVSVTSHDETDIHFDIRETFFRTLDFEIDLSSFPIFKGVQLISIAFGGIHKLKEFLYLLHENISSTVKFDKKHLPDVLSSLLIPSHISKNYYKQKRDIFFEWRHLSQDDIYKIVKANYPNVYFLNTTFRLPLIWSYNNPYAEGDFFEGANPVYGLSTLNASEQSEACSFKNLIAETLHIVNFIIKDNYFDNIKE